MILDITTLKTNQSNWKWDKEFTSPKPKCIDLFMHR